MRHEQIDVDLIVKHDITIVEQQGHVQHVQHENIRQHEIQVQVVQHVRHDIIVHDEQQDNHVRINQVIHIIQVVQQIIAVVGDVIHDIIGMDHHVQNVKRSTIVHEQIQMMVDMLVLTENIVHDEQVAVKIVQR